MTTDFLRFLRDAICLYEEMCRPLCQKNGILKPAFDILMFLANNPGCQLASDISRLRGMKPNTVSFHVEKLAQEGYIERIPVENDRRKTKLLLTAKADPIIREGHLVQKQFTEQLHKGLSAEDMEQMKRILSTIRENVKEGMKK